MDWLTPGIAIQIIVTIAAVGISYGRLSGDLKNIARSLDLERAERQKHADEDDKSFHDIRDQLQAQYGRLARLEGQHDLADRIAEAVTKRG